MAVKINGEEFKQWFQYDSIYASKRLYEMLKALNCQPDDWTIVESETKRLIGGAKASCATCSRFLDSWLRNGIKLTEAGSEKL